MYSGEYDVCDVTLSVYPPRTSLKNMPGHGGNRTYDLWNTSPMLCQLSNRVAEQYAVEQYAVVLTTEQYAVALPTEQYAVEQYAVALPTEQPRIFQACPGWIYTQSNITNIIFMSLVERSAR